MNIKGAGASGYAVDGNRPTSPRAWEIMSKSLRNSKLKMISPQEVDFALKRGNKVVDIRPEGEYTGGRIPGAVSVKFFRLIEGWSPMKIARRGTYAFFGILNGTEFNERFFEEFEKEVPNKNTAVILYCNIGGTLDPTGPSEFGQQSRSLSAAYELIRAGYKNVQVLKGGYNDWRKSGRDIELEE
jgi:rhodanese-related sulfurtransferase